MKKKIILPVMVGLLMVLATVGITYAFFNYTRTGSANIVRTGTINFTSSQTRINLSNVFPISSSAVSIDTDNVGTATITVTGDTTYDKGIEYLISATNVTNTVGTKNIPISIIAETSGTLGTSDEDYFDNRETSTNHIYKVLAKETINNDDQLMVGYIAKNTTGINGTINIKAYIDKDNILISDTYPEGEVVIDGVTYYNGTPTTNKTVFTTTEWNSLNTNGISFQIKVEANEGIWVIDRERNDMKSIKGTSVFTSAQKSAITEINFIKSTEEEINAHANLIDLTTENGNGMVKAWIDNNKLYIASPGTTYFPYDSNGLFYEFSSVQEINFNNINTSNVVNMAGMFSGCTSLASINLSRLNTINVTDMTAMFQNCTSLTSIDLSSLNTSNVTNMQAMFQNCTSLTSIDLSSLNTLNLVYMNAIFQNCQNLVNVNLSGLGCDKLNSINGMFEGCINLTNIDMNNFNFGNITSFIYDSNKQLFKNMSSVKTISLKNAKANNISSLSGMFYGCTSLISIDLSGFEMNNVTGTSGMFNGCTNLKTIYVSNTWDVSNISTSGGMFYGCTSLKGGGTPQTTYDANHIDKEYARIDGGANSSTPGYLTLKTN